MCIQNTLQQKIADLTGNGETIATFLVDAMRGKIPGVKACHRIDAAKTLTKYGGAQPAHDNISPIKPEDWEEGDVQEEHVEKSTQPKPEPTLRDIVAYPTARYIRDRTNEGETLVEALCDVLQDTGEYDSQAAQGFGSSGRTRPPAKPHHRLAAAKELLRRAFGETVTRRNLASYDPEADINVDEPINGHLANLVRDKTDGGTEAAELLIRIAENDRNEGNWTAAHRVAAARELLHRAYDLNYEAVTWEHVQAYRQATDFADEGETLERERIQAGRIALLREYNEAYDSGDEEATQQAEEKFNAYNRYIREGKTPEDAMAFATLGPDDPEPEPEELYTQNSTHPVTFTQERDRKHAVAAQIPTPRLTININNRSP